MKLKAHEHRYIDVEVERQEIWEAVEGIVIRNTPELAKQNMDSFFMKDGKPHGVDEDSRGHIDHVPLKISKRATDVIRALELLEGIFYRNENK